MNFIIPSNPTIATTNEVLSNGIASIDAIKLFCNVLWRYVCLYFLVNSNLHRLGRLCVSLCQRISRSDSELICNSNTFVIIWMTV